MKKLLSLEDIKLRIDQIIDELSSGAISIREIEPIHEKLQQARADYLRIVEEIKADDPEILNHNATLVRVYIEIGRLYDAALSLIRKIEREGIGEFRSEGRGSKN